jgi:hypothetical protein
MSLFSITTAGHVTFSLVLPGSARHQLGVYAAFRTPKIGLRQPIFDIMHSGVLEKRRYIMAQRVQMSAEPVVLSFIYLHARANSLCVILIDHIPM